MTSFIGVIIISMKITYLEKNKLTYTPKQIEYNLKPLF